MERRVFISYTSKDKAIAEQVCQVLEADGIPCWIAPRDIAVGTLWAEAIVNALDTASAVVVVFSQSANQSSQVVREVKTAVDRCLPIVNFWIDKTIPSGAMDYFLGITHWLNAAEPDPPSHLSVLLKTVRVLTERKAPGPDWPGIGYPWTSTARGFISALPRWTGADTPLIGHEVQLQQLVDSWAKAQAGNIQTAFVVGEAGSGKSRLVQEFLYQYGGNATYILSAKVFAGDQNTPYHTVIQLLRPLILQRTLPRLSGELMAEIARLVPSLRQQLSNLPEPPQLESDIVRQRQLWALVAFFRALCQEHPVILAMDDLQWVDQATVEFLTELIMQTPEAAKLPLMIVASLRADDEPEACRNLRINLSRHRADSYLEVPVAPLGRDDVYRLIESRLNKETADRLTDQLLAHTAGNPFFLLETIASLKETGTWHSSTPGLPLPIPDSVAGVIRQRAETLSTPAKTCAGVAAIIGREFDRLLIQKATGLSTSEVSAAIEELVKREFLREKDGALDFRHTLLQQTLMGFLTVEAQTRLHYQVGMALEDIAGDTPRPHETQQMANHFFLAQSWEKALTFNTRAGLQALSLAEAPTAQRFLEAAQDIVEKKLRQVTPVQKIGYLEGMGDLYSNQCKFDSAITYYKKTLAVMAQGNRAAPSAVDPGQRLPPNCDHSHAANLARQIGRVYGWQGQLEQALKWMKTGRNWLEGGSEAADQEVLALVDIHTASLRYQQGKLADAERLCRRALVLLGEDGNPAVRAEAWNMLGSVLDRRGKAQAALDAYRWSIGTWGALGNAFQVARVENNEAIIIAYQGELTRALTIYERILRYFREQVHDPYRAAVAMTNIGRIHAITGNYDTALEHHQHALKSAHELDIPWLQATALVNLTWALLATGQREGAETNAQTVIELATTKEVADSLPEAYRIMASVALSHGEFDDAIDWAIQARSLAVAQSNLPENGAAERLWGQALHLAGNAQGALSHLELGLQIWERIGDCFEIAQCRRLLALAKSDLGDDATAWRLVLQALTDLVKLPAKGDLAAMRAGGPMKFILTGAPNKVVATCRREMLSAGWARVSSDTSPLPEGGAHLRFMLAGQQVDIDITADKDESGVTLVLSG